MANTAAADTQNSMQQEEAQVQRRRVKKQEKQTTATAVAKIIEKTQMGRIQSFPLSHGWMNIKTWVHGTDKAMGHYGVNDNIQLGVKRFALH